MLSRLSIRVKIISVISLLLLAMAGMGLLSVLEMNSIHANAADIQTNWLPSVRELGDLDPADLVRLGGAEDPAGVLGVERQRASGSRGAPGGTCTTGSTSSVPCGPGRCAGSCA